MGVACLEFRGENFRGWLENREIRESFLPRKFPAIRYLSLCINNIIIGTSNSGNRWSTITFRMGEDHSSIMILSVY